jgi:transitional endoplasmic reticulum ATPase
LRSGRFDYVVRFAKPDRADRAAIIRLCCRRVPLAPDVDVADLAKRAEGFTGADVETLCKKATLLAIADFQRGAHGGPFVVSQRDFLTILESGPSIETTS